MHYRAIIVASAITWLGATMATAQIQTGSIFVRVRDPQGAVLPGVTVTIASPVLIAGEMRGITGADGGYRFPSLPPGVYVVTCELSGFQTLRREGIIVNVGATTSLELDLAVAGIEETVTVTGTSPVVDTDNPTVSTLINQDILQGTPGGRDIWNLLEYKVPALVSSRIDVGGSESGLQAGFVAKGTPHGQNTQALNGVNVTDPEAIGFADFYYDYDSFEEVQVSTAAHSVEVGTPGVYVNMVTKSGTDQYRGQGAFYYQSDETQGDNIDRALADKGVQKAGFDYLSDGTFQLGGPIVRQKLRFFTAWRDWRVHRFVSGFVDERGTPVVESTDMFSWLLNVSYQATRDHRFTAFWTRQYYDKPQRGASGLNTPLSNWKEDDIFDIYQGSWNGVLGANAFADARVSWVDIFFPLFIKQEAKQRGLQSTLEQTTGVRTGSNSLEHIFNRHRLQTNGGLSYYVDRWAAARHEFRVGFDLSYSPNTWEPSAIDQLNLVTVGGQPAFVTLYNTPIKVRRNVSTTAGFGADTIKWRRLTVNVGVRVERVRGYLPEQSSPPSQWFPDLPRRFARIDNVPRWTNASPRIGLVYDVRGNGKTAVKASYARYYYQISAGLPNTVNPNGLAGETFAWIDVNRDGRFQAGETGRSFGRFGALLTRMDPDIEQPYSEELALGVDREVGQDFRLSAVFTYRQDRRLIGQRTETARWIPTPVTDPDTGRTLVVYAQDPATIPLNRFVVTNADSLNITYRGLDVTASKRFSNRWQLLASYTLSRSVQNQIADLFGTGVPSVDPNALVNGSGPTFWDRTHIFKASASYVLPWEVHLSGNVRAQTGQPFSRQVLIRGLPQGNVTVNAEPRGERRYPTVTTVDLRASKVFTIAAARRLELMVDIYNVTNANTVVNMVELSGPRFEFPLQVLAPRIARVGVKFVF